MTLYILWNETENRPSISRQNFGGIMAFLTKEQAQAQILDIKFGVSSDEEKEIKYIIKEAIVNFVNYERTNT